MPDLFCFNPTNEMAVANNTASWQPNKYLAQLEFDLSTLPMFLSDKNDVLLSSQIPSLPFLNSLEKMGFEIPHILPFSIDEAIKYAEKEPFHWLKPWGWSLLMRTKLEPLFPFTSEEFRQSPAAQWDNLRRALYSRETALMLLLHLLEEAHLPDSIQISALPRVCTSTNEIELAHRSFGESMIKAPWSSSGRGVQPIAQGSIHPSILNWCRGVLKKQSSLMVEPFHHKVADFSFQFDYKGGKAKFLGISFFVTTPQGQYIGTLLNQHSCKISAEAIAFVESRKNEYAQALEKGLEKILGSNYCGHLGVDAMVLSGSNGAFQIDPVIEVNLRYNMGIVAMNVAKMIGDKFDMFMVVSNTELSKMPSSSYALLTELHSNTQVAAIVVR